MKTKEINAEHGNDKCMTRITLIERVRDKNDEESWQEFVEYYKNFIFILLKHFSVGDNDIDDLMQIVQLKLWNGISNYQQHKNNAKFRTWLGTVVRNVVFTYNKSQSKHYNQRVGDDLNDLEFLLEHKNEDQFEQIIEHEWKNYITTLAMENIKEFFSGKAIDVFTMTVKGLSADEIAQKLQMKVESVYVLRNRVKERLFQEVKYLRRELEF
ncbi:sigma-70 family RNA polymerase sigma factor [Lentisphaerota bacterium WC36G]|nr:sigma-70 family RNA polymerase sigma factor [Lentisphaerae bacterium WC36]